MAEEAVAEQDAQRGPPLRAGGGQAAPGVGTVHQVVVDEGRDVDELENAAEFDMIFRHLVDGAGGQGCECRSDALAGRPGNVGDVVFDPGVEGSCLFTDQGLHTLELRSHELEGEASVRCLVRDRGIHLVAWLAGRVSMHSETIFTTY